MSKHETNINSEVQFDLLPIMKNDREYSFRDYSFVITGFAVATWCFLIGGTLALFVDFKIAIIASIAGNMVSIILLSMSTSLPSAKYGIDGFTSSISYLGHNGTKSYLVLNAVVTVGWTIVLCTLVSRSVIQILNYMTGGDFSSNFYVVLFGLIIAALCWFVTLRGPHMIKIMSSIVVPVFLVVIVVLIVIISKNVGWGEIAQMAPLEPFDDPWLNFLIAFELSFGAGFSWWPNIGGLARICKTSRAAFWPNILGLVFAATVGTGLGAAAALLVGDSDPASWMIPICGGALGTIALILVSIANISANSIMIYTTSLGLKQLRVLFRQKWVIVTAVYMIPTFIGLFWSNLIYDKFYFILGLACLIYCPISIMAVVDYFLLRKQNWDMRQFYNKTPGSTFYYWKGFNLVAMFVFITATPVYYAFLDPISLECTAAFRYATATGAVAIYCAIMYFVLSKLICFKMSKGGYEQ
ncbi:MAG: cytosine permease [Clostridia bacterium]|nr:cytosine permease [Clostridia bacterium]